MVNKIKQFSFTSLAVVILILLTLTAIVFAIYQFNNLHDNQMSKDYTRSSRGGNPTNSSLPACNGTALLNHSPMDLSEIVAVEGLGHIAWEHILPPQGDHIYLNKANTDLQKYTPVYTPADVILLQVINQKGVSPLSTGENDYMLIFSPCQSVMFGYIHVKTISNKIQTAIQNIKPTCGKGNILENCTFNDLSIRLTGGEIMGTAIGLDFGGTDTRIPVLNYINKSQVTGMLSNSYTNTICPLDYFTESIKSQLYAKLKIKHAGANGIPACGTVMQDKFGTAQGDWYLPGTTSKGGTNFSSVLALAHYNMDPTQAVISSGDRLLPSNHSGAQIIYQPLNTGYINRNPSQILPDGKVYCIQGLVNSTHTTGHVDLQLTDSSSLKADYAVGNCLDKPSLSLDVVSYFR